MGHEPMERLMVEIDGGLVTLLRTEVDSFIKWHVIEFFSRYPNTTETADNVARYVGRRAEDLREEMAELSRGELLTADRVNGRTVYALSREPETRQLVRRFADSCDDQLFRIAGVYHILRRLR